VNVNPNVNKQKFVAEIKKLNQNQKVTLITGYNSTDL
jgi:ribosomal protein L10